VRPSSLSADGRGKLGSCRTVSRCVREGPSLRWPVDCRRRGCDGQSRPLAALVMEGPRVSRAPLEGEPPTVEHGLRPRRARRARFSWRRRAASWSGTRGSPRASRAAGGPQELTVVGRPNGFQFAALETDGGVSTSSDRRGRVGGDSCRPSGPAGRRYMRGILLPDAIPLFICPFITAFIFITVFCSPLR